MGKSIRRFGKVLVGVALVAVVAALAPASALADEPLAASSLGSGSTSISTQASASASCALLRKDGNFWRCSSTGVPVSKFWNGRTSLQTQLNKVRTVFIASDVSSVAEVNYLWTRYTYSSGRTSDYRYTARFSNSYFKNVKTVKFLTNSSGINKCTLIGDNAFSYATSITSFANLNKTKVTRIGERAFNRSNVASLALPKTLKKIGKYAFSNCEKLTSVSGLGSTALSSLGDYAFSYCKKLSSVSLPSACKVVGKSAFSYCSALKSASVGSKTTKVDDSAFYHCEKLASIALPATCKKLGYSVFSGCSALKKVTMRSTTLVTHAAKSTYSMSGQFYGAPVSVAGNSSYIYVPKSVLSKYRSSNYSSPWYNLRTKFRAI